METNLPRDQGSIHLWGYSRQTQLWLKKDLRIVVDDDGDGTSIGKIWRNPGVVPGTMVVDPEEWTE